MAVMICKNCGWLIGDHSVESEDDISTCDCCGTTMTITDLDDIKFCHMTKAEEDEYRKSFLGENQISPEMTQKRIEYEIKRHEEIQKEFAGFKSKTTPTVKCPYCQPTNTKKIGAGGRLLSTLTFGIASGKMGKQWHCNNCKSDF